MPGHYNSVVNLEEVVLNDYQTKVFEISMGLLQTTRESGTGETVLADTYVIQKEILNMISEGAEDGNASDDAGRLVNMVLDIEVVAPTPKPIRERKGSPRSNRGNTGSPTGTASVASIIRGAGVTAPMTGADTNMA
tara:strand:- start:1019 stop:1426 length:408 start_codon:yes stop_codon:yes gene_type:complete